MSTSGARLARGDQVGGITIPNPLLAIIESRDTERDQAGSCQSLMNQSTVELGFTDVSESKDRETNYVGTFVCY